MYNIARQKHPDENIRAKGKAGKLRARANAPTKYLGHKFVNRWDSWTEEVPGASQGTRGSGRHSSLNPSMRICHLVVVTL